METTKQNPVLIKTKTEKKGTTQTVFTDVTFVTEYENNCLLIRVLISWRDYTRKRIKSYVGARLMTMDKTYEISGCVEASNHPTFVAKEIEFDPSFVEELKVNIAF